jgi:outer membrane protein OmpA-like peptidoglycan-associated protein
MKCADLKRPIIVSGLAVLAIGCSSTEPNAALEQARNTLQTAEADPVVVEQASIDLDRARSALQTAESIYAEEGNRERARVDHNSYLATRYAETAMARADEARAAENIEGAEAERNRVLLEIRAAEAERNELQAQAALARAERNEQQAEIAQIRAASAEARARDLAQQIDELEAEQTDRGMVLTLGDVLFDVDEADLKPGAAPTLDQLADFLKEQPDRSLVIEGHTDSTGPATYNEQLSERRAQAVANALTRRDISPSRLEVHGIGESRPVASNDTSAGRQQNRRVEVIVAN